MNFGDTTQPIKTIIVEETGESQHIGAYQVLVLFSVWGIKPATRSLSIRPHEDVPSGGCGEQTPCNARPSSGTRERGGQLAGGAAVFLVD